MRALENRVSRLEKAAQQRQSQQPSTVSSEGGGLTAWVHHHRNGASATVTYDLLSITQEAAIAAILPRLPCHCTVFVVPRMLTPTQWSTSYSQSLDETLH